MNSKGKRSTIQNQKQRRITTTKLSQNKGITLIALVITIIVLLILAGVTIGALTGENGLITNAQLSNFATEMQEIKDNVQVKKNENAIEIATGKAKELFSEKLNENQITIKDTLKQEILFTRAGYPSNQQTSDYSVEDFMALVDEQGNVEDFYLIDKKTGNGKEKTYIYDQRSDVVFKISQTNIGGKVYHSYECASLKKGGSSAGGNQDLIIDKESEVIQVGDEYYYAPNMKGFNANETSLIYYSADFSKEKEIGVKEYIEQGEPYKIEENGETFTLHDYGQKIWANTKTTGNKLESWWVWIPRYAYQLSNTDSEPPSNVIYIGIDNKPLNPKYKGTLPEGYIVHPAFTVEGKELRGIWMSKYEPSYVEQKTSKGVIEPDLKGFDKDNTYIELYDESTDQFTEEIKLSEADLSIINDNNKWYDYEKKQWANIKTIANDLEAWWVWIPRYAYRIINFDGYKETRIIFIDTNNQPINKEEYPQGLPEEYIIHPAFTVEGKELKGIWMSKFEPSKK